MYREVRLTEKDLVEGPASKGIASVSGAWTEAITQAWLEREGFDLAREIRQHKCPYTGEVVYRQNVQPSSQGTVTA